MAWRFSLDRRMRLTPAIGSGSMPAGRLGNLGNLGNLNKLPDLLSMRA